MLLSTIVLCLLQAPQEPALDTVVLKGGKKLQGIILLDTKESLILGQGSKDRSLKRASVMSMEGPRTVFPTYIERIQQVYSARARAMDAVALAQWCAGHGMTRDVALHYWRALEIDPELEEAHLGLGHRKGNSGWTMPNGKGVWMTLPDLEKWRLSKDEPWRITTSHFDLEAVGSLHDVVRTAATLEVLYFHFYALLQPLGGFYELRHAVPVRIYRDRESRYPEIGAEARGYYDEASGVLRSWFEEGEVVNLVRLTTHALQYRAVEERMRSQPEQYPDWLWEGLATYFEACYRPTDGVPDYLPGHTHGGWIHLHAQASAKDRHELDTLLNFEHGGIGAHPDAQLLFAEAYTLCLFLLSNEDPSTLKSFKAYLHEVFRGQGEANDFRKAYSKRQRKALAKDWPAFVEKADLRRQQ